MLIIKTIIAIIAKTTSWKITGLICSILFFPLRLLSSSLYSLALNIVAMFGLVLPLTTEGYVR